MSNSKKENKGVSKFILEKMNVEKLENQKSVSFSQFSTYDECPHKWYLTYAKKLFPFTSNINTIFGTAIHEAIQEYLLILFNRTVKESEEFNIIQFFEESLKSNYKLELEKNNNTHFSNPQEFQEYYDDGVEILNYIKKKRKILFPVKDYELLGIEIPIRTSITDDSSVFLFEGYIDIVLRDRKDGTIYIDDFKTSKKGWTKYDKQNETKMSQVLFYKKYFSKQYGVSEDKVIPRFIILKRKLWEEAEFPQHRVQKLLPPHGTGKMNTAIKKINSFIKEAFDEKGNCIEKNYMKNPSKNNCRFCPFNDNLELCNKVNN